MYLYVFFEKTFARAYKIERSFNPKPIASRATNYQEQPIIKSNQLWKESGNK